MGLGLVFRPGIGFGLDVVESCGRKREVWCVLDLELKPRIP